MIRVETAKLVQLLGDLAHTADDAMSPGTNGILLHSARGARGDEPGETDLLIGTSTNRFSVGHAHIDAVGRLSRPVLWPLDDARAVIASYKPRLRDNKKHVLELGFDGDNIEVREDADLFGDGLTMQFSEGDLEKFPRGLWQVLQPVRRPIDDEPSLPRTDIAASVLAPFVAVAKARGEPLQLYRYHHLARVLVQVGHRYRGVLSGGQAWTDRPSEGEAPDVDIYPADLPEVDDAVVVRTTTVFDLSTATGLHVADAGDDSAEGR